MKAQHLMSKASVDMNNGSASLSIDVHLAKYEDLKKYKEELAKFENDLNGQTVLAPGAQVAEKKAKKKEKVKDKKLTETQEQQPTPTEVKEPEITVEISEPEKVQEAIATQ